MGLLDDLFKLGNGIRSGINDASSFATNVLELDGHGIVTDGRKIIGDVSDVLTGAGGLGIEVASVAKNYLGELPKWADSPILVAAQLVIEGEKKLTGSGPIETGNEYWTSAKYLDRAVETLVGAVLEDDDDGWNGAAAAEYTKVTIAHRKIVSGVSSSDTDIARLISDEVDQVLETRQVLDSTSQALYDYGLATKAFLAIPGANVAKLLAADSIAATTALATTSGRIAMMVSDSMQTASKIREASERYAKAMDDSSGSGGPCTTFVPPGQDQADLPTRLQPGAEYEQRKRPYPSGPPAQPLPYDTEGASEEPLPLPSDRPLPPITPPSHLPGAHPGSR